MGTCSRCGQPMTCDPEDPIAWECLPCDADPRGEIEIARLRATVERMRAELTEERRYLMADEERRKLTGDALHAESQLAAVNAERDAVVTVMDRTEARICELWDAALYRPTEAGPDDSAEVAHLVTRTRNVAEIARRAVNCDTRVAAVRIQFEAQVARVTAERDEARADMAHMREARDKTAAAWKAIQDAAGCEDLKPEHHGAGIIRYLQETGGKAARGLREAHRLREVESRVREIADEVLGLQTPDVTAITLLDGIERSYHRERIGRINVTAERDRLRDLLREARVELDRAVHPGRGAPVRGGLIPRIDAALEGSSGGKNGGGP